MGMNLPLHSERVVVRDPLMWQSKGLLSQNDCWERLPNENCQPNSLD